MNAKNATEIGGNYVGVEVKSIQDVVKAQAAGLIITDESGCRYNYWDVDEETGEEREPTEQEIFDRIAKALADGETVHACMEIMDGLYIAKEYNTVMHTDFYVGQKVYLLRDNKIVEDEIIYISLVRAISLIKISNMTNAIVKDLLAKNDWNKIIFRFQTKTYTLWSCDKFQIDSFCIYIYPSDDRREIDVLDIESLISMDIQRKKLEDIVEEIKP